MGSFYPDTDQNMFLSARDALLVIDALNAAAREVQAEAEGELATQPVRAMQLTQGLKRAAQANGGGIAVEGEGYRRTWRETLERIQRLAAGLRSLGLEDGERVAILALNSVRYFELLYAIAWAGGVFVPVNSRLAGPEVVHWLNDSEARIFCLDDSFLELWRAIAEQSPSVERLVYMADGEARQYHDTDCQCRSRKREGQNRNRGTEGR